MMVKGSMRQNVPHLYSHSLPHCNEGGESKILMPALPYTARTFHLMP